MTDLVQEIIDLVDGDRILRGAWPIDDPDVVVEHDFRRAYELAVTQDPPAGREDDEDWLCWVDIRELRSRRTEAQLPDGLEKRLGEALSRQVLGPYRDAWNEILADLVNCALSRIAVGTSDAFWERLLRIYRAGAWPCGSLDGRGDPRTLVAFVPRGRTDVVVVDAGPSRVAVLKALIETTGVALGEVRRAAVDGPVTVARSLTQHDAEQIQRRLAGAGATVLLVPAPTGPTDGE